MCEEFKIGNARAFVREPQRLPVVHRIRNVVNEGGGSHALRYDRSRWRFTDGVTLIRGVFRLSANEIGRYLGHVFLLNAVKKLTTHSVRGGLKEPKMSAAQLCSYCKHWWIHQRGKSDDEAQSLSIGHTPATCPKLALNVCGCCGKRGHTPK